MAKLKTGRHTSGLKENRKNIKRRKINQSKKSELKTIAKKIETLVVNKDLEGAKTLLNKAFSAFDKASKTGCLHKSKTNRKKAQLAKKVAKISK